MRGCELLLRLKGSDGGEANLGAKYGVHADEVGPLLCAARRRTMYCSSISTIDCTALTSSIDSIGELQEEAVSRGCGVTSAHEAANSAAARSDVVSISDAARMLQTGKTRAIVGRGLRRSTR